MDYIDELAKYTKKRRIEANYSLNKFCFDAEIEPASLSRYETGQRKISFEALIRNAKYIRSIVPVLSISTGMYFPLSTSIKILLSLSK